MIRVVAVYVWIVLFSGIVGCVTPVCSSEFRATGTLQPPQGMNPVMIIHGWRSNGSEWEFAENLKALGFPSAHIHVVHYDDLASWTKASNQIAAEFERIAALYKDRNQKFDIMTQSLGQFLTLHATMTHSWTKRVGRLVAVAGIAHGVRISSKPLFVERSADRGASLEPMFRKTDDTLSAPLEEFYRRYENAIDQLDLCSVYSTSDELIDPVDSGVFEHGKNAQIDGMRHEWAFKSPRFTRVVINACYDPQWPHSRH